MGTRYMVQQAGSCISNSDSNNQTQQLRCQELPHKTPPITTAAQPNSSSPGSHDKQMRHQDYHGNNGNNTKAGRDPPPEGSMLSSTGPSPLRNRSEQRYCTPYAARSVWNSLRSTQGGRYSHHSGVPCSCFRVDRTTAERAEWSALVKKRCAFAGAKTGRACAVIAGAGTYRGENAGGLGAKIAMP